MRAFRPAIFVPFCRPPLASPQLFRDGRSHPFNGLLRSHPFNGPFGYIHSCTRHSTSYPPLSLGTWRRRRRRRVAIHRLDHSARLRIDAQDTTRSIMIHQRRSHSHMNVHDDSSLCSLLVSIRLSCACRRGGGVGRRPCALHCRQRLASHAASAVPRVTWPHRYRFSPTS